MANTPKAKEKAKASDRNVFNSVDLNKFNSD